MSIWVEEHYSNGAVACLDNGIQLRLFLLDVIAIGRCIAPLYFVRFVVLRNIAVDMEVCWVAAYSIWNRYGLSTLRFVNKGYGQFF